jgi:DNA invertase Pin-like site-specific DNA recombinase
MLSWDTPFSGLFLRYGIDAAKGKTFVDDQQTLGLQVEATSVYIKVRGWDLVRQGKGSGARERPGREGLLKAAGRREIDVVFVWRLNR